MCDIYLMKPRLAGGVGVFQNAAEQRFRGYIAVVHVFFFPGRFLVL